MTTSKYPLHVPRPWLPPDARGDGGAQTTGVCNVALVERREIPLMVAAAGSGEWMANMCLLAIGQWMSEAWGPQQPDQCCTLCSRKFDSPVSPESFFIAVPIRGDGDTMIAPVCKRCTAREGESLIARCIEWSQRVWPNAPITRIRG